MLVPSFDRYTVLFIRMHIKWMEVSTYWENVRISDITKGRRVTSLLREWWEQLLTTSCVQNLHG